MINKHELRKQLAILKNQLSESQTLTKTLELSKQITSVVEEILKPDEKTLLGTFTHGQFRVELLSSPDWHDLKAKLQDKAGTKYHVIYTHINTNEINEELSDCIYLSFESAMNAIQENKKKLEPVKTIEKQPEKRNNSNKKIEPKKITDNIPQIDMTATYATIYIKGNIVEVVFTNETESNTVTFKYRKSWSYRKYINTAMEKSGIKPSWEFRYGWEWVVV